MDIGWEGRLGLLMVGDVLHGAGHPIHLAVFTAHDLGSFLNMVYSAVRPDHAARPDHRAIPEQHLAAVGSVAIPILLVDHRIDGIHCGDKTLGIASKDGIDALRPVEGIGRGIPIPIAQLGHLVRQLIHVCQQIPPGDLVTDSQ